MNKFKDVEVEAGGGAFLRLKDGENKVRIVSEPVPVWTAFDTVNKTARKYVTAEAAKTDPEAKKRHAMWVIDREDGTIKLAEFGAMIMGHIKAIATSSETAFDDLPPFDMIINRTGTGMDTSYTVSASRQNTELTEEEKQWVSTQESVLDFLKKDAMDGDEAPKEDAPPFLSSEEK